MANNEPIESARMMKSNFTGTTVYKNFVETQWCS